MTVVAQDLRKGSSNRLVCVQPEYARLLTVMLNYGLLVLTALAWGVTNVLIKRGSAGINAVKADNKLKQILLEIKFLFLNWRVRAE